MIHTLYESFSTLKLCFMVYIFASFNSVEKIVALKSVMVKT